MSVWRWLLRLSSFLVWKVTVRSQYESADYAVLESKGVFEIREYPSLMMVTTNMNIESQGGDGGFRRHFRYINGENEIGQKLAMKTPVLIQPDKDVLGDRMGFIIPKRTSPQTFQQPSSNSRTKRRSLCCNSIQWTTYQRQIHSSRNTFAIMAVVPRVAGPSVR